MRIFSFVSRSKWYGLRTRPLKNDAASFLRWPAYFFNTNEKIRLLQAKLESKIYAVALAALRSVVAPGRTPLKQVLTLRNYLIPGRFSYLNVLSDHL